MEYKAYAKINIGLNINYKMSDGYHDLESIMVAISMHDNITIDVIDEDAIYLTCNLNYIKTHQNLVYILCKYLKKEYSLKKGVIIHIDKYIPVSGGMGGGSSDCAVVLKALNKLWELNLSLEKQLEIGKKFGADIPFSIINKPSYVSGIGDEISPINFNMNFYVIVVKMPFGVSTKSIFSQIDFSRIDMYNISKIKNAIENNDFINFNKFLGNNMESVTISLHPEIQVVKDMLIHLGCFNSIMSGSGPTVLGLIDDKKLGKEIVDNLNKNGYESYICDIIK